MERTTFSAEEAAELRELRAAWEVATQRAGAIMASHGMDSPEFAEADRVAGEIASQIKKICGIEGQHWMAS